jgi:penicillin-binding protein 2
VHVVKLTVRAYGENASLAAQVLGYVGEISSDQLTKLRKDGYEEGDEIGRAGAEAAFESDLRGRPQRETLEVDPTGRQVGPPRDVRPGTLGHDVYLTIDAGIQRVAEESLLQGILSARGLQNENSVKKYEKLKAQSGAVVVLDVTDGSVVAMASLPSYDPSMFVGGITQQEYDSLQDPANANPLLNRTTQGLYAPGSTFKLATAVAMTRFGIRTPGQTYVDRGYYETGDKNRLWNAKHAVFGPVNLSRAVTVSSDAYFYSAGNEFWKRWKAGDANTGLGIQGVAKEFGFGVPTGIELGEASGLVPDPQWKHDFAQSYYKSDARKRANEPWFPGDNINVAIGQGDTTATPLQLADAYATFANGGTRWKAHLGLQVKDVDQKVVRDIKGQPAAQVAIDPAVRAQILQGLKGAVADKKGTAYDAFRDFPLKDIPVAGKTGTAQVDGKGDSSLFAAFWPADAPKYVAVAVVEEGGFGAQTAAPIVRRVIESMNGLPTPPVKTGKAGHD